MVVSVFLFNNEKNEISLEWKLNHLVFIVCCDNFIGWHL